MLFIFAFVDLNNCICLKMSQIHVFSHLCESVALINTAHHIAYSGTVMKKVIQESEKKMQPIHATLKQDQQGVNIAMS